MTIRVLTPSKILRSSKAEEIILPGLTGHVGVLEGHAALITALDTGLLRIKTENKWTPMILYGGVAEIYKDRITVLANNIEDLMNTNKDKATKELKKAVQNMKKANTSKARLDALIELKKANARLEGLNYLS